MTTFLHFTTFKTILSKPIIFFNIHKRFGGGKKPPLSPKKVEDAINAVKGLPPPPSHPYHRSMYSQTRNPHFRHLRVKIKIHKNNNDLSEHKTCKLLKNHPEYNILHIKYRNKTGNNTKSPIIEHMLTPQNKSYTAITQKDPLPTLHDLVNLQNTQKQQQIHTRLFDQAKRCDSHKEANSFASILQDNPDIPLIVPPISLTTNTIQPLIISQDAPVTVTKDSKILPFTKTLKNPDGIEYKTSLTPSSTRKDLSREMLEHEALNRHLIKKTATPTVIVETIEAGKIRVGNKENDLILTKHGRAYFDLQPKEMHIIDLPLKSKKELTFADISNLRIIALKNNYDGCNSVKSSPHMIAAYDPADNMLHSFGIFTSANKGVEMTINQEQFKKFQMKQQGAIFTPEEEKKEHNNKSQQLRFFTNIQVISKTDVYTAKYDQQYFDSLDPEIKRNIVVRYKALQSHPYKKYVPQIITDEALLQMCKDHDKEATKVKPKHPKTIEEKNRLEQLKLANQERQKVTKIIK